LTRGKKKKEKEPNLRKKSIKKKKELKKTRGKMTV